MITFTLRLPPLLAARLIAILTTLLMTTRPTMSSSHRPSVAEQHADNIERVLDANTPPVDTEIVLHVRSNGCTLDDGSPIPASILENVASIAFIRALIHDNEGHPMDATNRRRHPTKRQKRFVKERDRRCHDCGRGDLLEFDHVPSHETTGHTVTNELVVRCSPCHDARQPPPEWARV